MFKSIYEESILVIGEKKFVFLRGYYRYITSHAFKIRVDVRRLLNTKNKFLKKIRIQKLLKKQGIEIGEFAKIGKGFSMPHPIGIVIGKNVIIGEFCTVYQGVTIGQIEGKYPKIGKNVCIYPNSIIIGDINIGNNVIIGAGSIVVKDIPDNTIVKALSAK